MTPEQFFCQLRDIGILFGELAAAPQPLSADFFKNGEQFWRDAVKFFAGVNDVHPALFEILQTCITLQHIHSSVNKRGATEEVRKEAIPYFERWRWHLMDLTDRIAAIMLALTAEANAEDARAGRRAVADAGAPQLPKRLTTSLITKHVGISDETFYRYAEAAGVDRHKPGEKGKPFAPSDVKRIATAHLDSCRSPQDFRERWSTLLKAHGQPAPPSLGNPNPN